MNFQIPELESKLDTILYDLPGKIIAIDGRDGVGKTSLGRYFACRYNISLIELDLFIDQSNNTYYLEDINRIINYRLNIPRPIIIEGIKVMELLKSLEKNWDFLIYISNSSFDGSKMLFSLISKYEEKFQPIKSADFHLTFNF